MTARTGIRIVVLAEDKACGAGLGAVILFLADKPRVVNDSLSHLRLRFAQQLGLNADAFQACMQVKRADPLIERDVIEAIRLNISATPYLFINDQRVSGDVGIDSLRGYIRSELERAKAAAAQPQPAPAP